MSRPHRTALTLVELLVCIAIVGVLAALVLPAVQRSREASRRVDCQNNLRQVGLALAGFESHQRRLPAGRDAGYGRHHSWATAVLPYLEQTDLHSSYDWDQAWNSRVNLPVASSNLDVFCCPSAAESWDGKTDYGGNYGSALTGLVPGFQFGFAWEAGLLPPIHVQMPGRYRGEAVRIAEVTDGMSHTFLVLEDADRPAAEGGLWANGHNCFAHDRGPVNSEISHEIFSRHPAGAHALLGDGSVRLVSESVDLFTLGALCTRGAGDVVAE